MIKAVIDTNIVLDYMLERESFIENADKIIKLAFHKKFTAYLTATSITDIYYIAKRQIGHDLSKQFIKELFGFFRVCIVDKNILLQALESELKDFEDAVQTYSAIANTVNLMITRNTKDFPITEIDIESPEKSLERFKN